MYAGLPLALPRRDDERRIVHSQRIKNVLTKIDVERIATNEFHDPPDPIDTGAILPTLSGIEHERGAWRPVSLPRRQLFNRLGILNGLGIP